MKEMNSNNKSTSISDEPNDSVKRFIKPEPKGKEFWIDTECIENVSNDKSVNNKDKDSTSKVNNSTQNNNFDNSAVKFASDLQSISVSINENNNSNSISNNPFFSVLATIQLSKVIIISLSIRQLIKVQ